MIVPTHLVHRRRSSPVPKGLAAGAAYRACYNRCVSAPTQPTPNRSSLLYYSNVLLVVLAALLTLLASLVLFGRALVGPAILVFFATYLSYNLDNLVDWPRDRERYVTEELAILRYQKLSRWLMLLSAVGLAGMLVWQRASFLVLSIILASFVLLFVTHRSGNRPVETTQSERLPHVLFYRVVVATFWCLVCVFIPVWYAGSPMPRQALHVFACLWPLLFNFAVLWKLEKSSTQSQSSFFASPLGNVLTAMCIFSALLPLADVFLLRLFRPSYLVLILPALFSALLAQSIWRARQVTRTALQRLFLLIIAFCLFLLAFFTLLPAHLSA